MQMHICFSFFVTLINELTSPPIYLVTIWSGWTPRLGATGLNYKQTVCRVDKTSSTSTSNNSSATSLNDYLHDWGFGAVLSQTLTLWYLTFVTIAYTRPEPTWAKGHSVLLQQSHLVSRSNVLLLSVNMDPLSNVRTLLLQSHQHVTRLIVETCRRKRRGKADDTERTSPLFFVVVDFHVLPSPLSELS